MLCNQLKGGAILPFFKLIKLNKMKSKKEYQVLVYDEQNSIVSSQHFDQEPNEQLLNELILDGVKLECYEVEGDEYSKLLFSMDNEKINKQLN